jgi:hypothetical protein
MMFGKRSFSIANFQLVFSAFKRAKSMYRRFAILTVFASTASMFYCYKYNMGLKDFNFGASSSNTGLKSQKDQQSVTEVKPESISATSSLDSHTDASSLK